MDPLYFWLGLFASVATIIMAIVAVAGWTRRAFRETVRVIVKEEIAPLENRLQAVEGRLQGLENRLQAVEGRLQGLENRLQAVEKSVYRMAYILVESHNFQSRLARWIMAREAETKGDRSYELAELFIPEEIGIDDILVEGRK